MSKRKTHKLSKYIWWIAGCSFFVLLISGIILFMAFQRIPSWYRPIEIPQAEWPRVRESLPQTYSQLSKMINRSKDSVFALSEKTATEWVVLRQELYPDAQEWIPSWIRNPVVVFENSTCVIGARVDYKGWQAIMGIHLVAEVNENTVTIRVDQVTAGALPVPKSVISDIIQRLLNNADLDVDTLPDFAASVVGKLRNTDPTQIVTQGISWKNLFKFPNGKRLFKIGEVSTEGGELRVQILPQ